jgi:hypothetical protein
VRVLVEDGAVGADVARGEAAAAADGRDAARRQARRARADELGQAPAQLELAARAVQTQLARQQLGRLGEVLERVPTWKLKITHTNARKVQYKTRKKSTYAYPPIKKRGNEMVDTWRKSREK